MEKYSSPKEIIGLYAILLYAVTPVLAAFFDIMISLSISGSISFSIFNYPIYCTMGMLALLAPIMILLSVISLIYGTKVYSGWDVISAFFGTSLVSLPNFIFTLMLTFKTTNSTISMMITFFSFLFLFIPSLPVLVFGIAGYAIQNSRKKN